MGDKELECSDTDQSQVRSDKLKLFIREYFTEIERQVPETMPAAEQCHHEDSVRSDIRSFVCTHNDHIWLVVQLHEFFMEFPVLIFQPYSGEKCTGFGGNILMW